MFTDSFSDIKLRPDQINVLVVGFQVNNFDGAGGGVFFFLNIKKTVSSRT